MQLANLIGAKVCVIRGPNPLLPVISTDNIDNIVKWGSEFVLICPLKKHACLDNAVTIGSDAVVTALSMPNAVPDCQ